jgi:hypothetical protein
MEYIEPRQVAGRLFLVGRIPEASDSQWAAKLQGGVAWEFVVHYVIFDSHEDYRWRATIGNPGLWRRLFGGRVGLEAVGPEGLNEIDELSSRSSGIRMRE